MAKKHEQGEPYYQLEDVTPEMAEQYLQLNTPHNRPVSQPRVDVLAADMKAGKFRVTHQSAAFDWDGNILDGQHRFHAVVKSGCTVRMLIAYNCDPSTFSLVDRGRLRVASDLFAIAYRQKFGEFPANHIHVSSIAKAMIARMHRSTPESDAVAEFAMRHYKLIVKVYTLTRPSKVVFTQVTGAFATAALYFGEARVLPLAERFGQGMWSSTTDPLKILHERLLKMRLADKGGSVAARINKRTGAEKYGITVAALRTCLLGKTVTKLEGSEKDWGETDQDKMLRAKGKAPASTVEEVQQIAGIA